ncbi:hypothetical protein tb265_48070 [Gemmatimonadetes bacterium T265]|nr:hypothetical protein tb265_48070 [Gemmatimonadetes bacterium T265]
MLLAAGVAAMIRANTPRADAHPPRWAAEPALPVGPIVARGTRHHVVNDALMTAFCCRVAIKREVLVGEHGRRKAGGAAT